MIIFSFQLSDILADQILMMISKGFDINKLHIVGHSLGEFYTWLFDFIWDLNFK